jgi:DNA (cytosine-5)-methyltransferase 1
LPELRPHLSKIDDYPVYLEQCWQEHLQPRTEDAPTVISLFAGCGGSSLGYSMAGFKELLAVEWDDNAVETFKLNFPDVLVYHGDIARLSVEDCLKQAGLQPGELDVLDGSPPCQGFSTAGKRVFDDARNSLFKEYVRLLRGLKPRMFIMENVSGMVKGKMKLIFAEIMRELKASGYKVSTRLLNAMYFGVPQSRQRLIFVGVRDDIGIAPSHPEAETIPVMVYEAIKITPSDSPIHEVLKPERYKAALEGQPLYKTYSHAYRRLSYDNPAGTVTKGSHQIHPVEDRELLGREMARLASFMDKYRFIGGHQEWVDRIGNSVPPLFMRSIARHIRQTVLDVV